MTDITKAVALAEMLKLVQALPDETITSTSELMNLLYEEKGYTPKKGYMYKDFNVSEEEYYDLDDDFFHLCREHHINLDSSMFDDWAMGSTYHQKFKVMHNWYPPAEEETPEE